ncbi:MAG: hypothetical protein ACRENH_01675 [Gemmatimonadaceae bacterium]
MQSKDRDAAFMSALTTEHFVVQSSMSATNSESGQRASLYLFSLSSALVAFGFVSRTPEVFTPFVATVLPAVFLIGVFTCVRLVDANLEMMQLLVYVARIRAYYRTLSPDAEELLSPETGRWPEAKKPPALRLGVFLAFITTNASLVALINSIVGGAGIALLLWRLLNSRTVAVVLGVLAAILLMTLFLRYQRWRYTVAGHMREYEPAHRSAKSPIHAVRSR